MLKVELLGMECHTCEAVIWASSAWVHISLTVSHNVMCLFCLCFDL